MDSNSSSSIVYPSTGNPQRSPGRGLADYIAFLRRYFWIPLLTLILGTGWAFFVLSRSPAIYVAKATIQVDRSEQKQEELGSTEEIDLGSREKLQTIIEKMKLTQLHADVLDRDELKEREDLLPQGRSLSLRGPGAPRRNKAPAEMTIGEKRNLALSLRPLTSISRRGDTRLIDLVTRHSDPEVAVALLEGILKEYNTYSLESRSGESRSNLKLLVAEADRLRNRLLERENASLIYDEALRLTESVRQSEETIIQMEKTYLPKWPELIEERQLQDLLVRRLESEIGRIRKANPEENRFWEDSSNPAELTPTSVPALIQTATGRSRLLAGELNADRALYDSVLGKLKQEDVSRQLELDEFTILEPPTFSASPISPIPKSVLSTWSIGGLLTGLAIVLGLSLLDQSVRTVGDLEARENLPVLGAIPVSKAVEKTGPGSIDLFRNDEAPGVAESFRTLRAQISLLGTAEEKKIILITSALPGEGKSSVSSRLAAAFARQDERVVLVDLDLRRPRQKDLFELIGDPKGATDFLSQEKYEVGEYLVDTGIKNLQILTAGSRCPNPSELLGGSRIDLLFEQLGAIADRVIIDTAPILAVGDTSLVARHAQVGLLVVRMGKTTSKAVSRAISSMEAGMKRRPSGLIANALPRAKRAGAYGYYYSYAGGGSYGEYYGEKKK